MAAWTVTVRHGSKVDRERFDSLDQALAEAKAHAAAVLAEGGLGTVSGFRDYTPDQRVQARIEISRGGLFRSGGGIDVMGDGSLVPYSGAVRKEPLEAGTLDEAIEALSAALG